MPILTPDYSNINHEEMASVIGLKPKHIPRLIDSFVNESVTILQNLQEAINSKDFASMKLYSHSIKGSAGNLRFNEIYEMAKEMELSAADSKKNFDYQVYFEALKSAIATIS